MKIGPVLAGGNSIVIKPAEQTPLTALRLAALAAEAGIPDGVINVLPGYGETSGQALGRHRDVDCLSFTGSTEVGGYFLKYAAESISSACCWNWGARALSSSWTISTI